MLGKLFKHEFRATAKQILPVYMATLVIAFVNGLFMDFNPRTNTALSNNFVMGILAMVLVILIMTCFIMTWVMAINRFYKNVFGKEGYLTMTLPVNTWEIILTKSVVPLFWFIASLIVAFLAMFLLGVGALGINAIKKLDFQMFFDFIKTFFQQIGFQNIKELFTWGTLEFFVSFFTWNMTIFLAISIAQLPLFAKRKGIFSVLIAIFINLILSSTVFKVLEDMAFKNSFGSSQYIALRAQYSIVVNLIILVVFFFLTNRILSRHLNLEN